MSAVRLRAFVVLLTLLLAAGLAHYLKPTVHMADKFGKPDLETLFPQAFADWNVDASSGVIQPSPDTQALLDSIYNQTLTRTYVNAQGYRIMLSVAYGGDQSDATRAHLPEVCYPSQGFKITSDSSSQLLLADRPVSSRLLTARMGARNEPITYWLIVGDRVSNTRTEQKLTQFRLGLKGLIADGMLVRVSSIDDDAARGHQIQAEFLGQMAQAFPQAMRDRVFGAPRNAL